MQQRKIVYILIMLFATLKINAQESYEARVKKYIEQYRDWAIAEQRRSGVPAAITLAQGIHETSAGSSELALNANNHFGIKCKKEWSGETYAYTDDAPDECFRKYSSALQSYKDHSDYLAGSKRYESLFKLSINDYKGWATGLKRCGYATNPKYSQILIRIIEDYKLQDYTFAALSKDYNPVKEAAKNTQVLRNENNPEHNTDANTRNQVTNIYTPTASKKTRLSVAYGEMPQAVKKNTEEEKLDEDPATVEYGKLVKINGVKAFYAKKGTVLLEDAFKYNIRYAKLLEINELPDLPLEADMYIYLEKKNPKGIHQTHIVKPGETLIQIAQAEAMQLKYLKYYNHIGSNEEPVAGTTLNLQQYTETKPETYVKNVAPREESAYRFAGSDPKAIPQGATRRRGSYISKKEINEAQEKELVAVKDIAQEELPAETKKENTSPQIEQADQAAEQEPESSVAESSSVETIPETILAKEEKIQNSSTDTIQKTEVATVEKAEPEVTEPNPEPTKEIEESIPIKKEIVDQPVAAADSNKTVNIDTAQLNTAMDIHKAEQIEPIPVNTEIQTVKTEKVTINTPSKMNVPQIPEEPKDEFARLKAKLDKVVYAGDMPPSKPKEEVKNAEKPKEESDKKNTTEQADESKMYTVKKGDTAFSIAKKHNITMRQLMDWNKLDFETIKAGQKLRVKP